MTPDQITALAAGGRAGLTDLQQAILTLLDQADDGLALREIRPRLVLDASKRQVRWALAVLKKRGLVVSMGRGQVARWNREIGRASCRERV